MNTICQNCFKPLSNDRVNALKVLEVPERDWTCINCAPNYKKKAFFVSESGSSPMIFADKLGDVVHFVQPQQFDIEDSQPDIEELINH